MRPLKSVAAGVALVTILHAQTPLVPQGTSALLEELHNFQTTGTVLYVAAHPDDEDTQLIAYFARGCGYRTGYLSLTRGEGGQDLIGPEIGDPLGVIRTQELLAARRVDGGRQFFTLARDFGYSKDYLQTLNRWDRDEVLAEMVRVIRRFRPDVLITRFPPEASETHGHHTASAVLAVEAFRLAGDPAAFPQRLAGTVPWRPKRVLWDAFRPGFRPGPPDAASGPQLDIGGYNPLLGESYGEIAARSRSMHRSQGFGSVGTRGRREVFFRLLEGEPAMGGDPFSGIDTTWSRYAGGAEISRRTADVVRAFQPEHPDRSVPALFALRDQLDHLAGAPGDAVIADRRAQLDRIIQGCLGLYVETSADTPEAAPGQSIPVRTTVIFRSGRNVPETSSAAWTVPQELTSPYWLKQAAAPGMYRVSDPQLIGLPEAPAPAISHRFTVEGHPLTVITPVEYIHAVPDRGEVRAPVGIVPPVSLSVLQPVAILRPGDTGAVTVRVTPHAGPQAGELRLLPAGTAGSAGWTITPATIAFHLSAPAPFTFKVRFDPPAGGGTDGADLTLQANAVVGGQTCTTDRTVIRYPHIPEQLVQLPARVRAVAVDLQVGARRVGYIPGAGDAVAECLSLIGCSVVTLRPDDLTPEKLRGLDAVVLGVRVLNTRPEIIARFDGLLAYAAAGGVIIAQYNTPNELKTDRLGPYPLTLNRNLPHHRITDDASPVTLLEPDSRALTTPNRITAADFSGWVQERGLNFPSEWDPRYHALLSSFDPGETPQTSLLLVAPYGRGYYVYTGLSFFRQLPAGVPGAYRLFANLLSLGAPH